MAEIDPRELVPVAPELFVGDVPESVRFYIESLGFEMERDESPVFAVLRLESAVILLAQEGLYVGSKDELARRGAGVDIRIMVPDVDVVWTRVREAGVEIVHPIGDREYRLRDFIMRDPDGFRLRFASTLR